MNYPKRFANSLLKMVLLLALLLINPLHAGETLKLATLHWPPYVDQDTPTGGFTTEIIKAALKAEGYDIQIDFIPWKRGLKDTEAGRYDAIYPGYFSEDRATKFTYSESIGAGELGLFTLSASSITYKTLTDLKPYRIGIVRGYVNTKEFDEADYLQKSPSNSDAQNLKKLLKKRIDLAVVDKLTAYHLINTAIPEAKGKLTYLQPALQTKQLYLLFSKNSDEDHQQTAEIFNRGLQKIKDSGLYDQIIKAYIN